MDTDVDSSAVAGMTSDVEQVKGDGQKQEESEQETGGREDWAEAESVRTQWQFLVDEDDLCMICGREPAAEELGGSECWDCFGEH